MNYLPYLLVAYSTYLVGTISPGPANLAIMQTAMGSGRGPGVALALGVISGSICWGIIAALGLATLLQSYASAFFVLKIMGGLYLLWLAYRAARSALLNPALEPAPTGAASKGRRHYFRGFAIHMTNPKALFVWIAIISLGMPVGAPPIVAPLVVAGCGVLGVVVFTTYALAFSTPPVIRVYTSLRTPINAAVAFFFGFAGLKLLLLAYADWGA